MSYDKSYESGINYWWPGDTEVLKGGHILASGDNGGQESQVEKNRVRHGPGVGGNGCREVVLRNVLSVNLEVGFMLWRL